LHKIAIIIAIGALWLAAAAVAGTDPIKKVIVLPLYGSPENGSIAWVGEGIAESISAQLGSPLVSVMESNQVTDLMESMGFFRGVRLSRGSMIRIAQQASADLAVMGSFEEMERDIRISVRVFYLESLKLSGTISANGPLSALPQMENELAWQILTDIGIEESPSREKFYERTRTIPNSAFELYIQSFGAPSENAQRRLLLKAVKTYGNFPEAQHRLGNLYYGTGDCKSAQQHLMLSVSDGDTQHEVEFIMGTCYAKTDQLRLAIDSYTRILQDFRPFVVLNNLGVVYLRGNEITLALDAFNEANIQAPADSIISLNLAIAQQIQGNTSMARGTVEGAIYANPKNGMLQFLLGFLLKSQGEEEKAGIALQEATNLGIHIEELLAEDPKTWAQLFPAYSVPNKQSQVLKH